jgi:hypothetical protein
VDIWESSRLLETMRAIAHCWRRHRSLLLPGTAGTEPDSSIILYRTQIVIPAQNIRPGQYVAQRSGMIHGSYLRGSLPYRYTSNVKWQFFRRSHVALFEWTIGPM